MRWLVSLLLILGCGDDTSPAAAPAPVPTAPEALPPPPQRPTRIERIDAYPLFHEGDLVSCKDVTTVLTRPQGVPEDIERSFRSREDEDPSSELREHQRRDQDCATVTGRAALATCIRTTDGEPLGLILKTNWYGFGMVFESDEAMADCLGHGDTWHAVARNSPAALEAEGRHLARERERLEQRIERRR
jgi:hypothetical protein